MSLLLANVVFRMTEFCFYILGIAAFVVYLKRNGMRKRTDLDAPDSGDEAREQLEGCGAKSLKKMGLPLAMREIIG